MRSIPLHSLVLMVGPSRSGKSALAFNKFKPYEIIDPRSISYQLVGDRNRIDMAELAMKEVNHQTSIKLKLGERVVVDSSSLNYKDRMSTAKIGLNMGVPTFYIVVNADLSSKLLANDNVDFTKKEHELFLQEERDILRGDSLANVIDSRIDEFYAVEKLPYSNLLEYIKNQGFKGLCVVPDVHGMLESLKQAVDWARARSLFLVFLGDVLDYGPDSVDCIYLAYDLVMRGRAIFTVGNHERKIERWLDQQHKMLYDSHSLKGKTQIKLSEGNKATTVIVDAMGFNERAKFESRFKALLAHSRNHWVLGDSLLFTHAASEPEMFDIDAVRLGSRLESKALFGEIDQTTPNRPDGYPNRIYQWVNRVPNGKTVFVGHDIRNTIKPFYVKGSLGGEVYFMDTGSGKGGRLTTADILFRDNNLDVQNFTAH